MGIMWGKNNKVSKLQSQIKEMRERRDPRGRGRPGLRARTPGAGAQRPRLHRAGGLCPHRRRPPSGPRELGRLPPKKADHRLRLRR